MVLGKKTSIQISQKCKNRLDTYKDNKYITYEEVLNYLMDNTEVDKQDTLYEVVKGDCKAQFTIDYDTEELSFLDDINQHCNLDDIRYSFEDGEFQKQYDDFLRLLESICDNTQSLNLVDYASTLNIGETISVVGLTISRTA